MGLNYLLILDQIFWPVVDYTRQIKAKVRLPMIWPCYESAKNCHENANVFSTKAQM